MFTHISIFVAGFWSGSTVALIVLAALFARRQENEFERSAEKLARMFNITVLEAKALMETESIK